MAVSDDSFALIYIGNSRIGNLFPHVVLEEVYEDQLTITEHPVEQGAAVSDHAFLRAKQVDMKVGWADYKYKTIGGSTAAYEALLRLQARRDPIDVTTGKRVYKNMLISSISVSNDERTRFNVIATVRLKEVRISTARMINTATNTTAPQTTLPPISVGNQQPRILNQTTIPIVPGQNTRPPDASDIILPSAPSPI